MHHLAQAWLSLIIDISIKSILLAGVAVLVLLALRLRDTNLRHRVWTAVLVGMLAMPALVYVTPAVPLPGWLSVAIPGHSTAPNPISDPRTDTKAAQLTRNVEQTAGESPELKQPSSDGDPTSAVEEMQPKASGVMQPLAQASADATPTNGDLEITDRQSPVVQ